MSSPAVRKHQPGFDATGVAALAATVCLWSAFALSERALASSSLEPADAALIRFGVPAVLLAPALWRRRRQLAAMSWAPAAKILLGGGIPFYLAVTYGGSLTSAAFVGALVPGMVPLFAVALGLLGALGARGVRPARGGAMPGGGRPRGRQAFGLALIGVGVLALGAPEALAGNGRTLAGSVVLLLASALWAVYTQGLRETSLDPLGAMGLLCVPTFVVMALLVLGGVLPTGLPQAAPGDVLDFLLIQGVGTGICSGLVYAVAVRRLGAARCTTVGSLAPVLTAVAAVPLLGESLTVPVVVGTALIAGGVIAANRARTAPAVTTTARTGRRAAVTEQPQARPRARERVGMSAHARGSE